MKISSESAQSIVMEIGNIVGQNINMMDEKGYIIASTDPERVGAFHEGPNGFWTGSWTNFTSNRKMPLKPCGRD